MQRNRDKERMLDKETGKPATETDRETETKKRQREKERVIDTEQEKKRDRERQTVEKTMLMIVWDVIIH